MTKARQTSTRKEIAIAQAAAGGTKTAAARAAGVNRKTLFRWLDADLDFLIAFDASRTVKKYTIKSQE
jgi:hypothetical protein